MKIFYAVQATGNGHISRAAEIYPYLKKYGEVDFFVSGSNSHLKLPIPVKYKSKGFSLFFSECGGLDFKKTIFQPHVFKVRSDAKQLPVEKYDLVINDFEYITSLACQIKNVKSVQFGHQASFKSKATPRPKDKSMLGEFILDNYCKSTHHLGLHFKAYDDFILSPIIKDNIKNATVTDEGHITIYLPSVQPHCIADSLKRLPDLEFHVFHPSVANKWKDGNILYQPIQNDSFSKSMISCRGLITGGGFETPAEALYLGKRLMVIPIPKHYEQQCNAAALQQEGIMVLDNPDYNHLDQSISKWVDAEKKLVKINANHIDQTLEYLVLKNL